MRNFIFVVFSLCLVLIGCTSEGETGTGEDSDLIIKEVLFTQGSAEIDSEFQLYVTVANVGSGYAPSSKVRVYLSFNDELETASDVALEVSSGDTPVYDINYPTVSEGYYVKKSVNLTVPENMQTGVYYVIAEVDGENEVVEINENNNTGVSKLLLGVISDDTDAPDIELQSFSVNPQTVFQGSKINVNWSVQNLGNTSAGEFYVGVFLTDSNNTVVTLNDRFLFPGRAVSGGLAPNQTANQGASYSLQIPFNLPAGTYNVGVIADYMNTVDETDEINNYPDASSVPVISLTVKAPTVDEYPDIELVNASIIDPITGIIEAKPGEDLTVQYQLRNNEAYACPGFSVAIYLSSDANLDFVTDRLLAIDNKYWQGLQASASPTTVNYAIKAESFALAGSYNIFVVCDSNNLISESEEGNNISAPIPITITNVPDPQGDDITVDNLSDYTTEIGGEVQVTYDVTLPGSVSSAEIGFFISLDSLPGADDILVFKETVNSSNISRNVSFYIPVGFNAQVYFLFVLADVNNEIVEIDELNNTSVAKLTLTTQLETPDLTIGDIKIESSNTNSENVVSLPGDYLEVNFNVTNSGQASAFSVRLGIYLSTDSTIDFTDTLVGIVTIPALAPGATFDSSSLADSVKIRFTSSSSLYTIPPQTYYIGVMADDLGELIELYETNNTMVSTDFAIVR